MNDTVDVEVGQLAQEALATGRWEEADRLLTGLASRRTLTPEEHELLASAAYGAGRFEAAITAFEDAHAGFLAVGDRLGAAGAATSVATYLMMDTGLMAPVRGWSRRAEQLLEGLDEAPVHAWLAMTRTYERLLSGDTAAAAAHARSTIEIGTRQGASAPVAIARVATARLLILDGHVERGLELLDEVAVVATSGQLDPLPAGMVFCELICAMQGLAQYDRAEEWTDAMERWRRGNAFGGLGGRCRVHRAEILRLRGSCEEAEREATRACEELRPWMRREFGWPLTELGTIRTRRGELESAETAFLAAHRSGWDPQPGLALLRLAQGDVASASDLIADALERPIRAPSKERPPTGQLRRAPLLDAQVEIAIAAGDLPTAEAAAEELAEVADRFRSRALQASAALARGRVSLAVGDHRSALAASEEAVLAWCDVGAPFEVAVARLTLAAVQRATGNEEAALLELGAAQASFERIGAPRHAAMAAAAFEASGSGVARPAATWPVTRTRTVFRCDGDTRLVEYAGRAVLLRDLKGLRYLARLLAEPGREFHVLDLVATERGVAVAGDARTSGGELSTHARTGTGPRLDDQAKAAYRRRLRDIEEDLDDADRAGDLERAALAAADREFLVAELSRAVGLGGRDRPDGSDAERARTSVTRAVRYGLDRIAEHHRPLADHLQHTVRTGTYCVYDPERPATIAWEL
jgi:tetratricopeptide (TPR) repeat protein